MSPVQPPTNAPTVPPSDTPTMAPSVAPTACIDYGYNNSHYSMDGHDEDYIYDINITGEIANLVNSLPTKRIMTYVADEFVSYQKTTIDCTSNTRAKICFIGCYNMLECEKTEINIFEQTNLQYRNDDLTELKVICTEHNSCDSMKINVIDTPMQNITLMCADSLSCNEININISTNQVMYLKIYCASRLSCNEMNVNLQNANDNTITADIFCNDDSSCDNVHIYTNNGTYIALSLEMYKYSSNIEIVHDYYKNIDFVCTAPNEKHFIRYDTKDRTQELSDAEIFKLAQNEYQISHRLPCEGITVYCTENSQCSIEYELVQTINHLQILRSQLCYWLEVNTLYTPICVGTCGDAIATVDQISSTVVVSLWVMWCAILVVIIVAIACVCYNKKRRAAHVAKLEIEMTKKTIIVRNPMVILIPIGKYDSNPVKPEITGKCADLDAVDVDIENLKKLFTKLRYKVYTKNNKFHWKEKDIRSFLKKQAQLLDKNKNNFDGLFLVLSCHGVTDYIVTSDFKIIRKEAIHRYFSASYPLLREIPRIFLYDCCAGSNDKKGIKKKKKTGDGTVKSKMSMNTTINTAALQRIDTTLTVQDVWGKNQLNPDHRLVTLHAANMGFISKINTVDGSYFIKKFVDKTLKSLEKDKDVPFIGEIFEEIQEELHNKVQLPTYTYNNGTRWIKLKVNDKDKEEEVKEQDDEDEFDQLLEGHLDEHITRNIMTND
eukprot:233303_1